MTSILATGAILLGLLFGLSATPADLPSGGDPGTPPPLSGSGPPG